LTDLLDSYETEQGDDQRRLNWEEEVVVCGCGPDWQVGFFFAREELEGFECAGATA
jgi:hypothetical protein